jgi:hypothetical protein
MWWQTSSAGSVRYEEPQIESMDDRFGARRLTEIVVI